MNGRLFLCVVGGGTKTEALLADFSGQVLGRGLADGSNALTVGRERAAENVLRAVRGASQGVLAAERCALYLFIPGFSRCLPLPLPHETVLLGDSPNAYFGALGQPGGIALLAGTGSFAVSYDAQGRETSVGGWGPMLGDEGSGYDIGRRAVRHALHMLDEGKAPDALSRAVLAHYGIADAARLVHVIYHANCDREHMAALCPAVGELARAGDAAALNTLDEAACALASLAATLQARLALQNAPTALTGGVSKLGEVFWTPLRLALARAGLALCAPLYNPSVGGVLYAYQRLTGRAAEKTLADAYFASYGRLRA